MAPRAKLTEPTGKHAELYRNLPNGRVKCTACARNCQIGEGQVGFCGVRGVVGGKLYLLVYGRVMAGHVDPIEKKPVVHYRPGSKIFSVATSGCSWACAYCFSPSTPILTDKGILSIEQIYGSSSASGEIVFPDPIKVLSRMGRWRFVNRAFRHSYHGKMVRVRPYYLPEFECTPEHSVFVSDPKSGELLKRRADQLKPGDFLAVPRPTSAMTIPSLDVATILLDALRVQKASAGRVENKVEYGDNLVRFKRSKNSGLPRVVTIDEGFGELLGLYAAGGSSIRSASRPNSWTVCFSFGSHEEELIIRAEELLRSIFRVSPYRVVQGSVTRVTVGSSELGTLLDYIIGSDCYSKRVPDFILLNSLEEVRNGFLRGYMQGDGFNTGARGQRWMGTTSVSRTLTLGVWYLMFRKGLAPRFYISNNRPTYEIEGRTVSRHNDYMTRIFLGVTAQNPPATKILEREGVWLVPIRSIREEADYNGYVYNLEVEEDHSYTSAFVAVSNCQNADISQLRKIEGIETTPDELVANALGYGCEGMAYTYNQPTIFMEYARDIGKIARSRGLFNIFVTNGYDTPETVAMMDDFLDCATVDFKGSGETDFVRKYISIPSAAPIFESLLEMKRRAKVHLEITDLIVPGVGESLDAARKLCNFVYDNLGPDTPVHFLRFHPDYKMMDIPPTPVKTLERHVQLGRSAGLNYVYIGNVPGHPDESTYCPGCKGVLIKRYGYEILEYNLDEKNRCRRCGYKTPIVGPLSRSYAEDRFASVIS